MKKYDIIIVGGGTSGVACAYTAGKLGLKTLLIEKNSFLGGDITSSLVIPAMKTSDKSINNDFFNTLYNKLSQYNGAITYSDNNKGWFNPELTKIVLDEMLLSVNVEILFDTVVENVEEKLSSYLVSCYDNNILWGNNDLLSHYETLYLIDATGSGKICEILNHEFLDNENKSQPVNLRFIMSGINVEKFENWLLQYDLDRNVTTAFKHDNVTYLSTAYTWDNTKKWALEPLFKQAISDGVITDDDSNYFQIFSVAGTCDAIAFNCPRLLKNSSKSALYIEGRQSILRLSNFCKKYLPGFENAYISSIANQLGVRVTNRVKCEYIYTKEDLISGKKFDNPVVISNYPIDIHSSLKNNSTLQSVMQEYQLPLEALKVKNNLFVIGKCLSAEFEAQAALRIIPSCFSMGEGVAKYIYKTITNNA